MAGISDKAFKSDYAENKYRFNKGSELQNKEFSDGTGLEMYETNLRELDPQLGRWWQVDSKPTEAESPYSAMGNNPILRNDALGDSAGKPEPQHSNIGFRPAEPGQYDLHPVSAFFADLSYGLASFLGLTNVESAVKTVADPNASIGDKVQAVAGAGLATTRGEDGVGEVGEGEKTPVQVGKEGMDAAGVTQNTTRIPSASGTANYRVPDGLTENTLTEVKNVANQSLTNQIKDFSSYSTEKGMNFELHVRESTKLSEPLKKAVLEGKIRLKFIPEN